jgi:CelD/BcsL family acetyltransferase involved in cellulose biosynthesis
MARPLETFQELDAVRDEWRLLGERSGNVFATWEWAEAWWRHYGEGEPLLALARGDDGQPAALVALELHRRGPLRVARFVGHGPADEMGPIAAPGDPAGAEALQALHTAPERRWDVLLAERLAPDAGVAERLGSSTLLRESSPIVEAPEGGFEAYLKARSRNFRSQVRRKERALLERGLTYRLSDDPDRLEEDMRALGELHEARWGAEGSGALAGLRAAFHLDFARAALERGWLRLWLAEMEGRPAAAWYGFRFGSAEWYYQSGRHPDLDKESIGLVLLAHTLRAAFDDGIRTYRLLRGGESYKDRFATSDPGVQTEVAGRGALGKTAERASGVALRLTRALRSARRGSGGAPSTIPRPSG